MYSLALAPFVGTAGERWACGPEGYGFADALP
jgi:hypothetical protein